MIAGTETGSAPVSQLSDERVELGWRETQVASIGQ
jgi:hypothetical protein